jgi:hypothetical protein
MTISGLLLDPELGTVGKPLRVSLEGDPTGETRFYLYSTPSGSKLSALSTYDPDLLEREQIRLSKSPDGSAAFTPDAAGAYYLIVYDVQVTQPVPHFGGQVVGGPTDNELSGASGVLKLCWVAEARSRTVGVTPDTATLTVRGYNNEVAPDRPVGIERVTLAPAKTANAQLAAQAVDVLVALDAIESSTDVQTHLDLSAVDIAAAIAQWNAHVGIPGGWNTHAAADSTNVAAAAATDLPTALALLNDLKAQYNAHRVDLVAHGAADATNVVTAATATDFATGLTLWTDLRDRLWAHMVAPTPVHAPAATYPVDGAAYIWLEPPRDGNALAGKTNSLRSTYEEHRVKVANTHPHAAVDTENVVLVDLATLDGLIATVNAWADAIERHVGNRKVDGSLASPTTYHQSSGQPITENLKIPLRASDAQTAKRVAELCLITFEAHASSGGSGKAHASKAWGWHGVNFANRYCLRLARAWHYATRGLTAPTASYTNSGFASLVALGGWT